jgi:long-chain acyl-CoA synthetase
VTGPSRQTGYGQTEISGLGTFICFGGVAAGRPSPLHQFKILDESGREVPDGVAGEIAVRGPMVMSRYWNREAESAARSRDGWHHTHDVGKRLEDGSIRFIGPKTSMIKSGGENIYPAEVEACIRQHVAVLDVCVIGTPDRRWHQNVKAVVVLKKDAQCTSDELIEHCRVNIASYKKPKAVEFTTELPRSAGGQLDREQVDALFGGGGYPKSA